VLPGLISGRAIVKKKKKEEEKKKRRRRRRRNTSTCFEQYYAHPQEVKIVFLQHLVSSLCVSGRAVHSVLCNLICDYF
jgi:hypothetical protein